MLKYKGPNKETWFVKPPEFETSDSYKFSEENFSMITSEPVLDSPTARAWARKGTQCVPVLPGDPMTRGDIDCGISIAMKLEMLPRYSGAIARLRHHIYLHQNLTTIAFHDLRNQIEQLMSASEVLEIPTEQTLAQLCENLIVPDHPLVKGLA
jgi:hypothetical protein